MRFPVLFTTSLLICTTKAFKQGLPDSLMRLRRWAPSIPLNISHTEHTTKMYEYQNMTKGTEQQREFELIGPSETTTGTNGDVVLKFISQHFGGAEDILLKMLVSFATHVSVFQTRGGEEVEIKSQDLPNYPLWVDAHLVNEAEITVRIACGPGCTVQYPTVYIQYEVAYAGRAVDFGGVPPKSPLLCRNVGGCCLTELRVKLVDLVPYGLEQVMAPVFYDASYCSKYICKKSSGGNYYAHVRKWLTLAENPISQCTANFYKPLTVVTVHPDNNQLLVVSIWEDAIATNCNCY